MAVASYPERARVEAPAKWAELLERAVREPGVISDAYSAFWRYSFGNQMLARWQCFTREVEPSPIASFRAWQRKGRQVTRGQKAIILCQPITRKRRDEKTDEDSTFMYFQYKAHWFLLSQTEPIPGFPAYVPEPIPHWDQERALQELGATRVPFRSLDGNAQGYSDPDARQLAINPLAKFPNKTIMHELAHVLLHAGDARRELDAGVQEVEAEAVALLCTETFGLDGVAEARGYIQSYLGWGKITEEMAKRIFKASTAILEAGRTIPAPEEE